MGNGQAKGGGGVTPAGIQSMDETLQKKFSKGVQFNMKIVLRGDRNTGKTCLFHRMEGKGFLEAYIPTSEIQVTSILWSYKVTNDTVKVEVWDVVDKGRVQKKELKGILKLFNSPSVDEEEEEEGGGKERNVLDASFLDVYKGCHGAVLIFDMTKIWTWKYVERELPKVPLHVPVIILGNFRELGEHRTILKDEVMAFVETLQRPDGAAEVLYAESSMKNGFGLMHLHKFLSIPFLQLQQEMLLQQLQVNREQMLAATEELSTAVSSEDQNYSMFLYRIQQAADERRRRAQAAQQALEESDGPSTHSRQNAVDSEQDSVHSGSSVSPHEVPNTPRASGIPVTSTSSSSKLSSRFSGFLRSKEKKKAAAGPIPVRSRPSTTSNNIENFVPDGEVDSFLGEGEEESEEEEEEESEEDEEESSGEGGPPLVAADEDLSSPEPDTPPTSRRQESSSSTSKPPSSSRRSLPLKSAKEVELTESEKEEEGEEEEKTAPVSAASRQRDLDHFWGERGREGTGLSSEHGGIESTKPKKKAKGLLLDWAVEEPHPKPQRKGPGTPELPEERKERRKKSSKKGRHRKKETEEASHTPAAPATAAASTRMDDPYGLTSSLDAWLNAGDILQPTPASIGSGEKGQEVGEEEEEEEEEREKRKKSKKHHHRRHSELSRTSHTRKHKSRHSKDEEHSRT